MEPDSDLDKRILKKYAHSEIDTDEARYLIFRLRGKQPEVSVLFYVQHKQCKYRRQMVYIPTYVCCSLPAAYVHSVFPVSEAQLIADYVHPFLQALFAESSPQTVPHVSDQLFGDNITNNTRPDYRLDAYDGPTIAYSNVVGKIKTAGASQNLIKKNLCHIALYAKELVDKSNLEAAIAFQAVDRVSLFTRRLCHITEYTVKHSFLLNPSGHVVFFILKLPGQVQQSGVYNVMGMWRYWWWRGKAYNLMGVGRKR
ncbi:hypothetical protein RMATCC62417_13732 [Rhizopus microsporus]|nr:hypothetical protein RMATCC62417_13732 [Rhizopus microsporus]